MTITDEVARTINKQYRKELRAKARFDAALKSGNTRTAMRAANLYSARSFQTGALAKELISPYRDK